MSISPIRYYKSDASTYVLQVRNGNVVREGRGLAFWYWSPRSTLVAIPANSTESPFMFSSPTADYQEVTVQGAVIYQITDPVRLSQSLNFSLKPGNDAYKSEDPEKLEERILNLVQAALGARLRTLPLADTLTSADALIETVIEQLRNAEPIRQLGVTIEALSILAIRPTPETARALEAERRESVLQEADEAIYRRRNASVDQERSIKENELQTDITVAERTREVRESEMEVDRSVAERRRQILKEELEGKIANEERKKVLVALASDNARTEADAKAYRIKAVLDAISSVDPKVLEAAALTALQPDQLIAKSFQSLAERADKIGELNISPDLMRQLVRGQ